jgi:hypothetical protein
LVNLEGVDVGESPTEALTAVGAVIDDLPERNALIKGVALEMLARGWALFVTSSWGVLAATSREGFTAVCDVDLAGEDCNRSGSIWSSLMAVEGDEIGRSGELFSSPNGPRGELG